MRKVRFTLLILLMLPLLLACQPSGEGKFRGYLYFVQNPYLMRFSLRDFSLEAVTHLGNTKVREISEFGEDRLLFAETVSLNRKNVARISWLDLEEGRAQPMYSGVQARYIASADAMVYDDGSRLYLIKQTDGTETTSEILSHKRHQLFSMLEVSNGRLLLEIVEDGVPTIQSYRAAEGTLTRLDGLASLCRLKGAVWIDDLEQLACKEQGSENDEGELSYVFADLDGTILSRPSLPQGNRLLALAYIGDQGLLVLNESRTGQIDGLEKSAVWVHNIHTGVNHELSDTLDLGSSVVYSRR